MSAKTKKEISKYFLSPKKFHLELPLYFEIKRDDEAVDKKMCDLLRHSGTIDAYCIWCEKDSVFDADEYYGYEYGSWDWLKKPGQEFIRISYLCTRDGNHAYFVYYLKKESSILKIGQYPSVADFQIPQAEKYRELLGEEKYKELTRGIGLAANGVGIGSFVYLRRIFEQLVEEAHTEASKKRFPETKYSKARMDEKIMLLQDYLPKFLVENRSLYSILSKGIHELDENECLKYFDPVRIGIEQILDEKITQLEKEKKALEAKKAVQSVSQVIDKEPEKNDTE